MHQPNPSFRDIRLAKMRHALDGCAPFRPHGDCDGRLRRDHFPSPRPTQNNRPAFILAEQTGLKTNPSKHVGLDRSLLSKGELQPKLYVAGASRTNNRITGLDVGRGAPAAENTGGTGVKLSTIARR
jgi:hypothetical protein